MKKLFMMSILIAVVLAGCTPSIPNSESEPEHSLNDGAIASYTSVNLLTEIDATGIEYIEPTQDSIYIIGVKRDKSLPQRELIYAVYDLNTNSIDVIHRDYSPIDGAHNMSVYHNEHGETSIFTGQKILTTKDSDLISELEIPEKYKREVFVDMKHDQLVYVDENDLNLYLHAVDHAESQPKKIYESSHTMDEDGNEHILFPYNPRFNYQGDKVLFGIAEDDTSSYQKVMIYDIPSGEIVQTDDLTIYADFLDFLWYNDGFITLEITDYLGESLPTGGTIFTQYDAEGKLLKRTVLDCMALSCQRKFYSDTGLYAFGYRKNDSGGLAIYDIDKKDIYSIHQSDDHIVSPTVSNDGKKVLWVENGTLHINAISSLTQSRPIGFLDAEMISGRQPSQPDVHPQPDASPATIDEEIIIITPNRDLPSDGPPQPDGPPTVIDEETGTRSYSEGTMIVSYAEIMGTVHAVEVDDKAVKDQILAYVDGMQPSDYNAMNTPPSGRILDVEVHRNGQIEQYAFSEIVVDGNSLGKNLQDPDKTQWTIVDKDAFAYLSNLFES